MGLSGGNFTNPLDFTSSNDNSNFPTPLEALPNFGVDLANPLDSSIATQLSSPFGAGNDSSGQSRTGSVMDMFGSLTLDFSSSQQSSRSSSPMEGPPNPFETTKSLINAPQDIAESVIGGDPGGLFQLGRDISNKPIDQAKGALEGTLKSNDSVNQSDRTATTGDASSETRNLSANDSKGRYNPNELSLTLYDKISEDPENYSVLAMFAMQFLKSMNLEWGDRAKSGNSGEAASDPKVVESIRARRTSAPVSMARNAYNSSGGRPRVSPT